ncbi:uncharacterized protein LOC132601636 [Lycium barbarum]|uniref:uncharacterized protein LOC132601636 n=1 Tax=Lycium barbarum TaxID=112863 RepID=UPI00293F4CAE|nr:uncharacterized protein LOC132601636 [Lycium barbarum]
MNGAVEASNKNIKRILRKMIDNYKDWHEQLPFALLGYRTTTRTSTKATPYLLVYGTETVIPTEVEIPSLRIIQEAKLNDAEWVKNRYEQLAAIDEKENGGSMPWAAVQTKNVLGLQQASQTQLFQIGQLVLKQVFPHQEEYRGKLVPNWQGPYMVLNRTEERSSIKDEKRARPDIR